MQIAVKPRIHPVSAKAFGSVRQPAPTFMLNKYIKPTCKRKVHFWGADRGIIHLMIMKLEITFKLYWVNPVIATLMFVANIWGPVKFEKLVVIVLVNEDFSCVSLNYSTVSQEKKRDGRIIFYSSLSSPSKWGILKIKWTSSFTIRTEAVARRCSVKQVFLGISQNSLGNNCVGETCNFIKKETCVFL